MDSKDIDKIHEAISLLESREQISKKLIAERDKGWYWGIIGLDFEGNSISLSEKSSILLQKVHIRPLVIEVARAIKSIHLISEISRYTSMISCQLYINEDQLNEDLLFFFAWSYLKLLKIKLNINFLVPFVSNYSIDTIPAIQNNTCTIQMIEDYPIFLKNAKPIKISVLDNLWLDKYRFNFINLIKDQRFRLAVTAQTEYLFQPEPRMAAALLWSGIESLLSIQNELSFRISIYTASILGETQKKNTKYIKK